MGMATMLHQPLSDSDKERFWAKVDRRGPDECWPWRAATDRDGYGAFNVRAAMFGAHRVSWKITTGATPTKCVCHTCDNPRCVNPAHLWLGTHQDNMQDKIAKGRARGAPRNREQCKRGHTLTPDNLVSNGSCGMTCRACRALRYKRRATR